MKKLLEKTSFPMLMMAVIALTRIRNLIPSVLGLVRSLPAIRYLPANLCDFAAFIAPFAFLLVLILEKAGKIKSGKKAVGITAIAAGIGYVFDVVSNARIMLSNPDYFSDMYMLITYSPIYTLLVSVVMCIMMLAVGIGLVRKEGKPVRIGLIFGIGVFVLAYTGIIASFGNGMGLVDKFYHVLYMTGLFYLPRLYDENKVHTTAISGTKIKVLLAVLIAMVLLFSIATGSAGGSGHSSSSNTCKSCGRSWEAGDSGKNFMNIARTGMCNNCEGNYHSLKPFLGK